MNNLSNRKNIVNPLEDYLYIRLTFCSWRNYMTILRQKAQICMNNDNELMLSFPGTSNSRNSNDQEQSLAVIKEDEGEIRGHQNSEFSLRLELEIENRGIDSKKTQEIIEELPNYIKEES